MRLSRRAAVGLIAGLGAWTGGAELVGAHVWTGRLRLSRPTRIGYLGSGRPEINPHLIAAFKQGLAEHGWQDGQNVVIEWRFAEDKPELYRTLATDLVSLPVDVIVATTTPGILAAKLATAEVPIVMAAVGDPVGSGLIAGLAHPGANVTGTTNIVERLAAKRLEILHQVIPGLTRVGVVWTPSNPVETVSLSEIQTAAQNLQVHVLPVEAETRADVALALAAAERLGAHALLDDGGALTNTNRSTWLEFGRQRGLATMGRSVIYADEGGLMAYGPSNADLYRRSAAYVDTILRGAHAEDLPVEQPTVFEFAINVRAAETLGITIPASLAAQVTDWIQ